MFVSTDVCPSLSNFDFNCSTSMLLQELSPLIVMSVQFTLLVITIVDGSASSFKEEVAT